MNNDEQIKLEQDNQRWLWRVSAEDLFDEKQRERTAVFCWMNRKYGYLLRPKMYHVEL